MGRLQQLQASRLLMYSNAERERPVFIREEAIFQNPPGKLLLICLWPDWFICLCLSCRLAGKMRIPCGRETCAWYTGAGMAVGQAAEHVPQEPHVLPWSKSYDCKLKYKKCISCNHKAHCKHFELLLLWFIGRIQLTKTTWGAHFGE